MSEGYELHTEITDYGKNYMLLGKKILINT